MRAPPGSVLGTNLALNTAGVKGARQPLQPSFNSTVNAPGHVNTQYVQAPFSRNVY